METRRFIKFRKRSIWERRKDYNHQLTFGSNVLGLPDELLYLTEILDQGTSAHCTAYDSVSVRESMTGRKYDPEAQWKLEMKFLGIEDAPQGIGIDTPMQVGVKVGFALKNDGTPVDKAGGYFTVNRAFKLDLFDSIRTCINRIQGPLSLGLIWYADWDQSADGIVPHSAQIVLGGHATKIAGFTKINGVEYIVVQNSWGEGYGKKGLFFFDRYMVNAYFNMGVFYFSDNMPAEIKRNGLILSILQNLLSLYAQLATVLNQNKTKVPPDPLPGSYLWDTHDHARHSVRLICDEEGLIGKVLDGRPMKDVICACLELESHFNNNVTPNTNKDGTRDYGICQINDYWHIGRGKDFPSVEYVLANPEKCVRWMVRLFRSGHARLWSSYSSGKYKMYL